MSRKGGWSVNQVMVMMMDYLLRERDNTTGLDKAIEKIVDANGCFDGEYVTRYRRRPIKLKCE